MAQSFIAYDKDLPEIPGRCPWEKPASFLVKDETAPNGWRVNEEGRRPSKLNPKLLEDAIAIPDAPSLL